MIHSDIKPENIFITSDFHAKIGDFDVSKNLKNRIQTITTFLKETRIGFTFGYAAPEFFESQPIISTKSDIYSFGVSLMEMISKKNISSIHSFQEIIKMAQNLQIEPKLEIDSKFIDVIKKCVQMERKQRPSGLELLKMDYFKEEKKIKKLIPGYWNLSHDLSGRDFLQIEITNEIFDPNFEKISWKNVMEELFNWKMIEIFSKFTGKGRDSHEKSFQSFEIDKVFRFRKSKSLERIFTQKRNNFRTFWR